LTFINTKYEENAFNRRKRVTSFREILFYIQEQAYQKALLYNTKPLSYAYNYNACLTLRS